MERIQKIRDFLLGLTKLAENLNTEKPNLEKFENVKDENTAIPNSEFNRLICEKIKEELVTSSVLVSKDGVINFLFSEWAEAVQGVNISRLRLCEICKKFFGHHVKILSLVQKNTQRFIKCGCFGKIGKIKVSFI